MAHSDGNEPIVDPDDETVDHEADDDETIDHDAAAADDDDDDELTEDAAPAPPLPAAGLAARLASFHLVKNPDGFAYALALSIAAAMILPFLGSYGFFDPWESHYAEVARQMAQRDDYLYPYWKNGYFFSKPVLLFWLTAPLYKLAGAGSADAELPAVVELCGRLPVALLALLCISCVWFAARRLWGRRAATLAAVVLATTPFFALIARQAITDMLYVGPMSAAICLLAVAFFDDETREAQKEARLPWWLVVLFGLCLIPQLWEIGRTGAFLNRATWLGSEFATRLAASGLLTALAVGGLWLLFKKARDPLIHAAAVLVALATLGKGPHAVVFTGLPYFLFFVVSGEWRLLRRPALISGIVLYLCVAMPWYIVMTLFEGKDEGRKVWFQRFVLYDLFGRLGGVHGQRGTHDYYVRYFAFGTMPWTPLMPLAVITAAVRRLRPLAQRTGAERFDLLCVIWAIALFAFFTATNTKFHHYIFPVVVPSALLVGRWLDRLLRSQHRVPAGVGVLAVMVVAVVGRDLVTEPWQIADLFSYHYVSYKPAYYFPEDLWWRISVGVMAGVAVLLLLLGMASDWAAERLAQSSAGAVSGPDSPSAIPASGLAAPSSGLLAWLARPALLGRGALAGLGSTVNGGFVAALLLGAFAYCAYCTHVYQTQASQHWTHRHLLHTYWSMKEPADRLVSYQMDWKGETFYAHNTEQQIKKSASDLKKAVEEPGRTFILVQQDRFKRIESALGGTYKDKLRVVDRSNKKWFLVVVDD